MILAVLTRRGRSGTVESKIRQLVMKLEYVDTIVVAHPFVKGFEDICYCVSADELRVVSEGSISPAVRARTKADTEGVEGACTVYSTNFFIGLAIEPRQAGAAGPRRLDISYPTSEFTKMVKMWDQFEEEKMSIVVRMLKRSAPFLACTLVLTSSAQLCPPRLRVRRWRTPGSEDIEAVEGACRGRQKAAERSNTTQAPDTDSDTPNKRRKYVPPPLSSSHLRTRIEQVDEPRGDRGPRGCTQIRAQHHPDEPAGGPAVAIGGHLRPRGEGSDGHPGATATRGRERCDRNTVTAPLWIQTRHSLRDLAVTFRPLHTLLSCTVIQ
jgi:hypothetical protein